eukprot:jgi/Psemu1/22484/gm1.22484_g
MPPMNKINRVHRTKTSTKSVRHNKQERERMKGNNENRTVSSSTTRKACFLRSTILCLAIVGVLIFRYPSFIRHNMQSHGNIVLKFDDIATTPLRPKIESIQGRDHYYMFPPTNTTGQPKGILLYLHSCQQSGLDFFTLPEHRIFALGAIQKGMIIFSPTSYNRKSGCFTSQDTNGYLERVVDSFVINHQLHRLPRVGLGDSSGGSLLPFVYRSLNLESIAVYNSPQGYVDSDIDTKEVIPTVYLTMYTDGSISERMNANMLKLREMNVSTYLYKVSPRPFTESLCAARFPELPHEFCQHIFRTIGTDCSNLLDTSGFVIEGGIKSEEWKNCFKKLESDYGTKSFTVNFDDLISYQSAEKKSWLQVILEHEIQTCHGFHAMTAQFHNEVLEFLMANGRMNQNQNSRAIRKRTKFHAA